MLGPWHVCGLASPPALVLGIGSVLACGLSYIKLLGNPEIPAFPGEEN